MKHKLVRIFVVLGIVLIAYAGAFLYAGKQWLSYLGGAVPLISKDNEVLNTDEHVSLYLENLQTHFYGIADNGDEVIFAVTEWKGDYLVICLDSVKYSYAILRWTEYNFDYDVQASQFDFGEFRGTLLEMDEELRTFILETQGIYLGDDLEGKLLPFVFVEEQVGIFTFQKLETVTKVIIGITAVGALGIVVGLLVPTKKKKKIVVTEEEKESE